MRDIMTSKPIIVSDVIHANGLAKRIVFRRKSARQMPNSLGRLVNDPASGIDHAHSDSLINVEQRQDKNVFAFGRILLAYKCGNSVSSMSN